MPLFSFAIGLTLRRGEQLLEFRRHLDNGQIQFEDPINGRIYTWDMSKIFREIENGDLNIVSGHQRNLPAPSSEKDKPALISSLDSLPVKQKNEIERRLDYITSARKQGIRKGQRKDIGLHIVKVAKRRNEKPPKPSTVMAWWRTFEKNDFYPGALISGDMKRKNHHRLPERKLTLIRNILKQEYFTQARKSLAYAHLLINRAIGNQDGNDAPISMSTVRRVANEITPYHRDIARFGAAYARNKWRYSLSGINATRVLQRVEIDHTQLDVVVICDRSGLPFGRPTITVVIDSYSGYVISFFVSFWGAGLGPTLNALKIAISPKDRYCISNAGLNNPWLGYGLFELAVVDNGLEFHSPQFKMAAWNLNADIQYCAVRQPWLKPSVERVLGTLGLYLPTEGKVYKPEKNYLPPNPRKTAAITFSQLCIGLLKCFVDILPFQTSNRTLQEPFTLFKEGFERLPPAVFPSSFNQIDLISAISKQLTVGNEGVVFEYLRYNSVELQELRRKLGHTFRTTIKFHPENLSYVYVQDCHSKNWLYVPCCDPEYTETLTLLQHKMIRAHSKDQLTRRNSIEMLQRGKLELMELYDGFLSGNRGKKNKKVAQIFGTLTSAQSLAAENDREILLPPDEKKLITPESMSFNQRDIPSFNSFQFD
jgi:putative transposase